jgi:hypothetical protein
MKSQTNLPSSANSLGEPEVGLETTGAMNPYRYTWVELRAPTLGFLAFFVALFLALEPGHETVHSIAGFAQRSFSNGQKTEAVVKAGQVLVISADERRQNQAIATLTPRGFEPLLAGNLQEVQRQLAKRPASLRLVVLDAGLSDSESIAQALHACIPAEHILTIAESMRADAIGPLLLNRL